jgi:hypothetical protein
MTLRFFNELKKLEVEGKGFKRNIKADCIVRNELNGWRKLHIKKEVILGITQNPYPGPPVMPREFPKGRWEVYSPLPRTGGYLAPYFIPTDAEQYLETWDLDENGGYNKPNGGKILDIGYGLHFSTSNTTVGCIKIHEKDDLIWLKNLVEEHREEGQRVWLEVPV